MVDFDYHKVIVGRNQVRELLFGFFGQFGLLFSQAECRDKANRSALFMIIIYRFKLWASS